MATVKPTNVQGKITKIAISIFVLIIIFSSFTIVPAGHRGVVFNLFSGVEANAFGEGLNFKIPIVQQVTDMEIRTQKYETGADSSSADLQMVQSTIALNYRVDPSTVSTLYKQIGLQYEFRIIQPAIQESIKAVTARYSAEELITKRQDVREEMRIELKNRLSKSFIIVEDFNIVDFQFSDEFNNAIEQKVTAEQQALKATRDLQRIKIEAEQKVTQATAEAEALKIQRQQVTAELIKLRQVENQKLAIEKWDGVMPEVVAAGNGDVVPMLPLQISSN